jgi:hypothetical protein
VLAKQAERKAILEARAIREAEKARLKQERLAREAERARLAAEADAARIKAEAEEAERERLRVKEEEERLTAQLALEAAAKAKRDARYARARRAPAACRQAANPRLSASHKARRNLDGLFALKPVNSRA